MLSVRISPRRSVLDTTLCDKVCQWLATGRWFSPDNSVSSTNKTDRHDITEILLKPVLPCEIHWMCYRMAHCHVALVVVPYGALSCCTGCGTVWRIARWEALVVVAYDTLLGERHWSWYRMPYCHVKYTGRSNVWHIARWNTLVVVPYDIMPGEIHWSWYRIAHCQVQYIGLWYRIAHCQVKYTGCGTTWHIDWLHWSWYRKTHCQVKYTGCGTVWHIARLHWSWYRILYCQVKYTGCGTVWHFARLRWLWYRMPHCQVKYTGCGTVWCIAR
jgi:hypothetical protein